MGTDENRVTMTYFNQHSSELAKRVRDTRQSVIITARGVDVLELDVVRPRYPRNEDRYRQAIKDGIITKAVINEPIPDGIYVPTVDIESAAKVDAEAADSGTSVAGADHND